MASGGKFKGNKDSCYTCSNPIMLGTEFIISWSPKILPLLLSVSADSKIEWEEEMVCEEAEACMNHRERCELWFSFKEKVFLWCFILFFVSMQVI